MAVTGDTSSDDDSSSDGPTLGKGRSCGGATVCGLGLAGAAALAIIACLVLRRGGSGDGALERAVVPGASYNYAGHFEPEVAELASVLPRQSLPERFPGRWGGSAAVVANSPEVIGSSFGQLVDAHDIVVRFNFAPTKGYEADVGARTDIRIIGGTYVFWEGGGAVIHRDNPHKRDENRQVMAKIDNPSTNRVYFFSEEFMRLATEEMGGICKLSSGALGVMLGLYEFRNVSLFGFKPSDIVVREDYQHYFPWGKPTPLERFYEEHNMTLDFITGPPGADHDFDHEHAMFQQFADQGRLRLY